MQGGLHDNFATSFSSSRSRWNTKCKRDATAPPIWLRKVLNDATNVETGILGNSNEHPPSYPNDFGDRLPADHRSADVGARDTQQWRQPSHAGISSEDASDLYLNPLAFSNHDDNYQQLRHGPSISSALPDEGSYASIHAAVSAVNLGGRGVQSARRTRVNTHPLYPSPRYCVMPS